MHDAVTVRRIEGAGDFRGDVQGVRQRKRASGESRRQRLPFEILEHEKRRGVRLADVVQRADMRVIELRDRLGLALEPRSELEHRKQGRPAAL